ncbi:MAG: lysophospholipid acyltransferase family protein [Anaerolineales bacterium]
MNAAPANSGEAKVAGEADRLTRSARKRPAYDHRRFEWRRRFVRWALSPIAFPWLIRIDHVSGIENVPATGPAIVMFNHIAFVDPLIIISLLPRNVVGLAKAEVLSNPLLALVPWAYGVITVRRGEVDRLALVRSMQVLQAGEVLLLAPEGTRSPALLPAKEGVAYLAAKTGAPIVPVAVEGTEGFPSLRRGAFREGPGASIRFGRGFQFKVGTGRPDRETLHRMTDEAMYILAAMLPPERRGAYSDLSRASQTTFEFV